MKKITQLLLVSILLLSVLNCYNDDLDSNPNTGSNLSPNDLLFQSENFGDLTTGDFLGVIKSRSGQLLENVRISIGNAVTFTDRNGRFVMNDVDVFENFAYIKASKDGFIDGSRSVIPKIDGQKLIEIVLYEKEVDEVVNSGENIIISASATKLRLLGDYIDSDGNPYDGPVEVVLDYLNPGNIGTFRDMPGSLLAQSSDNDAVYLESLGMVSVNLFSPSGELLNLAENSSAIIEFPITSSYIDSAPDTIPLWYFDESVGYWKQEGEAFRLDNRYIANVSHFSWWNVDIPLDIVELCFNLQPELSDNAMFLTTIKSNDTNLLVYSGIVNADGNEECGPIPQNEELTLSVYSTSADCGSQLVHQEVIGEFSVDSSIDISFIEDIQVTNIVGTATNCDGIPISNGYLFTDNFNTFSITNGVIDFNITHCNETETTVQIFDFDSGQWVIEYNIILNGNEVNLGALSTCEDTGGIFNGNIILNTQEDVNEFGLFNYSGVTGFVNIGEAELSDISDLTPLSTLTSIGGNLRITNTSLTSLVGFENLTSVFSLIILDNSNLNSLEGLENLSTITNSFFVDNNDALTSFVNLESLQNVSTIIIYNNDSITSFSGFEQINQLNFLWIAANQNLISLDGLDNVNNFEISNTFPNILIGFGIFTDTIDPGPNENLGDFCALSNLFMNGNGSELTGIQIGNNAFNPTVQDLIDGNCNQ